MKFTCPKCSTRHQVADSELSAGQVLRFACPVCSNTISVRRRDDTASGARPSAAPSPPVAPAEASPSPVLVTGEGAADGMNAMPSPFDDDAAAGKKPSPSQDFGHLGGFESENAAPLDPTEPAYLNAPPGESTRLFMETAGIYKRRRNARIAAVASLSLVLLIAAVITADITGAIVIPGMGMVYDMAGLADPNLHRAIARTEARLADSSLTPAERETLRRKLLGLSDDPAPLPSRPRRAAKAVQIASNTPAMTADPNSKAAAAPAAAEPDANGKRERLALPIEGQEAPLEGLPQAAIMKVVKTNNRSLALCYAESSRKHTVPNGKMEVQLTIKPSGDVSAVSVETSKYKNTPMGQCAMRRVKNWKFPPFTGEPVTAVFPYVISASF